MVKCVVSSCPNRQLLTANRGGFNRGPKRFFSFPKDPARIKVWLAALREPDKQDWSENHVICEDHFLPEDISAKGVSSDAIPIMPPCLDGGLGINAWPEDQDEDEHWAAADGNEEEQEEEEEEEVPVVHVTPYQIPEAEAETPLVRSVESVPEPQRPSVTPQPQQEPPPQDLPKKPFRHEVSLQFLTRRFLELLVNCDGSLDLRQAADRLQTRKRRVYDVTNVLQGLNLIQKESASRVKWIGKCPISSVLWNQQKLEQEYEKMKLVEETLDGLIKSCAQQLFDMTDDSSNAALAYLTHSDVQRLAAFQEQTVIVVRAPEETKLEVPAPKEDNIQIHLKAEKGPIAVVTCEVLPYAATLEHSSFLPLEQSRIRTSALHTESSQSVLQSL